MSDSDEGAKPTWEELHDPANRTPSQPITQASWDALDLLLERWRLLPTGEPMSTNLRTFTVIVANDQQEVLDSYEVFIDPNRDLSDDPIKQAQYVMRRLVQDVRSGLFYPDPSTGEPWRGSTSAERP